MYTDTFFDTFFQALERAVSKNVTRASRLPFLRARRSRYFQNATAPWKNSPAASPIRCVLHSLCNSAPPRCPFPDLGKMKHHERTQETQSKLRLTKHSTKYYIKPMKDLMTRTFRKWVSKQPICPTELTEAIAELKTAIKNGNFKEVKT